LRLCAQNWNNSSNLIGAALLTNTQAMRISWLSFPKQRSFETLSDEQFAAVCGDTDI